MIHDTAAEMSPQPLFWNRLRMKQLIFLFGLASSMLAPAVLAQAIPVESLDKIVAVLDEEVILRSELDRAVANILAQAQNSGQLPPRDVIEKQVLDRLILTRVQVERATSTGIKVSDVEVDQAVARIASQNQMSLEQLRLSLERDGFSFEEFRKTMREELTVQRFRQRYTQSRVQVTDTEIDILLASDSLKTGEVRLQHILVGVADGATPEQVQAARERAERVLDHLRAVLGVANDGVARHGEMAADLVGAPGFDADDEVAAVMVGAQAVDVRERAFALDGQLDRRRPRVPAAVDHGAVGLGDAMPLEDVDDGIVGGGGLGHEQAARRVAVETVGGDDRGHARLGADDALQRVVGGVDEDAARLVDDEVVGVLVEDGQLGDALRDGGRRFDGRGHGDRVAGFERVPGDPDGLAFHPDDFRVDVLLGHALRDAQVLGEEILQGKAGFGFRDHPFRLIFS